MILVHIKLCLLISKFKFLLNINSNILFLFFRSEVIIYNFNYTILPTIPLNTPIQQPTNTQYTTICGAIGTPSTSVEPYIIDICGYFSSITNRNIQLLMDKIGEYYSTHRMSLTLIRKLNIESIKILKKNFQ